MSVIAVLLGIAIGIVVEDRFDVAKKVKDFLAKNTKG